MLKDSFEVSVAIEATMLFETVFIFGLEFYKFGAKTYSS